MTLTDTITSHAVPDDARVNHVAKLFGTHFPMSLEPYVFGITNQLSPDYTGGLWEFLVLSNGGFYMAPHGSNRYRVVCENGFQGELSADALGITACLYAYSHLSFGEDESFAAVCAEHYHWLRAFMMDHAEARMILRAID